MLQSQSTKGETSIPAVSDGGISSCAKVIDFIRNNIGHINFFKNNFTSVSAQVNVASDVKGKPNRWHRVKELFIYKEYEDTTPELKLLYTTVKIGLFGGFVYGGTRKYARAYDLYSLSNDVTLYMGVNDCRRKLVIFSTKEFVKGGFQFGPKLCLLSGAFVLTTIVVSTYRGINGYIEYPISGAVTFALMKWNLGVRGMLSGCISGGLTGFILSPFLHEVWKIIIGSLSDEESRRSSLIMKELKRDEDRRKQLRHVTGDSSFKNINSFLQIKAEMLPPPYSEDDGGNRKNVD